MKNLIYLVILLCVPLTTFSQETDVKFKHILITNDDGIENIDILTAFAKSVKPLANRVSIVVSSHDRSGSSNYLSFGKHKSSYEVTTEYFDRDQNIGIYTLPGYPADCVLISLSGLFSNDRPDLVLSGINGGSNIGPAWFNSGTIGAVRTASVLGVPGIAFSGFDDDHENSFSKIPGWIVKFLKSGIVDTIDRNGYLTVAFPEIPLDKIKGIKVSERQISYGRPESIRFEKVFGDKLDQADGKTLWAYSPIGDLNSGKGKDDVYYLEEGYIIITAMSINENNQKLSEKLKSLESSIPKFNN